MPSSVGRNEPCPCGSGKKYKRCCLGKTPPAERRKLILLPIILAAAAIGGGIYAGLVGGFGLGIAVIAGGLVIAGLVYVFRDPPPPSGKGGDAAAINFGSR